MFDAAPAFWVWHRSSPLKPAELESLKPAGTRALYWQAAEFGWKDGKWVFVRVSPPQAAVEGVDIIPVFRIKPDSGFLGAPWAADRLAKALRIWSEGSGPPGAIQIDFDCPARLLTQYAGFLKSLAGLLGSTKVSATALASWPDAPGFQEFAKSVTSVAPMFYDLTEDKPEDVLRDRFHPMADPEVGSWIRKWADCPVPWMAGLPNFERLSVFAADGKPAGHIRGWEHDPVFFHPALKVRRIGNGTTVFEIGKSIELYGTALKPGMKLVHRTCDPVVLDRLRDDCRSAGAAGVVFFTLPGPGIQAAFTPAHLASARGSKRPNPDFSIAGDGAVTLKNPGPADLPAGIWELKLHSSRPATFLSGSPGEFVESATSGDLPPEMAGTLVLRFSRLPAGASITSGRVVANGAGVTWQLVDALEAR